ncbi:unnamed protein product, partial [Staurois parvus]
SVWCNLTCCVRSAPGLRWGRSREIKRLDRLSGPVRGVPRGNMKKKTNSTPKDPDTQEIPFKLREIMKSRMEMDKPKKRRRPVQTRGRHSEGLQTDIPVPKFKRERNESVGAFLSRMNRETQH